MRHKRNLYKSYLRFEKIVTNLISANWWPIILLRKHRSCLKLNRNKFKLPRSILSRTRTDVQSIQDFPTLNWWFMRFASRSIIIPIDRIISWTCAMEMFSNQIILLQNSCNSPNTKAYVTAYIKLILQMFLRY